MRAPKSFHLFWKAVKTTRHEMWVSFQILLVLTLILSYILYLVEHNAQPDVFTDYWDAFLWSWMGYIDDPGEFATYAPITFWGRVLKIACALVNIAIFAIPAGLIAGGFSDAIADDKREKELQENKQRIKNSFRRKYKKPSKLRVVPRYVSVTDVQVNQEIDSKDIIDTVRMSDEFRLSNLANAVPDNDNPVDRLVIESIPQVGKTSYGCCIDRGSRVTIVAPSAAREVGTTNFAYYLALFGGFNYVSKEYLENRDTPASFYMVNDPKSSPRMEEYLRDLRRLSHGDDRWTIMLIVADSVHPEDFFFITKAYQSTGRESTLLDKPKFDKLFGELSLTMASDYELKTDLDNRYVPVGSKNVGIRIGGGETTNAFTLRIDWSIIAFNNKNIDIALTLASVIASALEGKEISLGNDLKKAGIDYQK